MLTDFLGRRSEEPCKAESIVLLDDGRFLKTAFIEEVEVSVNELPTDEQIRFRSSMVDAYKMILTQM